MPNPAIDPILKINREFQERATRERAQKLGFEYVDIADFPINLDVLRIVSQDEARRAELFPFERVAKTLRVAIVDPERAATKALFDSLKKRYDLEIYLCSKPGFERAMKNYEVSVLQKKTVSARETVTDTPEKLDVNLQHFSSLESKLPDMPAKAALAEIEMESIGAGASDIHFQPTENGVTLRLRVDGVLHNVLTLSDEVAEKIITRIKYESGMRSNISDAPQDGHITVRAGDRFVDLRVSTIPTATLESVVLRILDSRRGIRTFSELGFAPHIQRKILKSLHQQNGIILVTGPTGSGKTTTLYSMLAELNTPERKLVTLEDPIEYHLPGVSQSQVNDAREYNFETGFKSLLRHDPDVILVGEIRTIATARLAFEAALTGHTVLSSLHTNSAIGAISRLRNMGMENYNIAPTVNAVFAQKLVRRVCPICHKTEPLFAARQRVPILAESLDRIASILPDQALPETISVAAGCDQCSGTGYQGLTAVCEALFVTDEVREMILRGDSPLKIREYVRANSDFLSLWEDGVTKILDGVTTVDELQRVAGEEGK
ncbi:MAG: GspE/PulE family protein [Candidatus Gracilibacteria bacterium]|nr:GspE/PulE family protein [Candidatus Gracilibacteria bacterium]